MINNSLNQNEVPGRLIAVEGLDGAGKSTQIKLVKRWLELDGCKVFFTEWNSSPLVRQAAKKGKKQQLLTPTTFALMHCTDFADRYERQVLPLLNAGYIVLADRYAYTAFARDAARGCDREWIRRLYSFALAPHLTFFFDLPSELALSRLSAGRPKLKHYEAGMDLGLSPDPAESFRVFQGRIREEYLRMSEEFGFITIDSGRPPEQKQQEVRRHIAERIDLEGFKWKTSR
jgi:dTMP kinase